MKYVSASLKYAGKNFLVYGFLGLVPSIFLGIFSTPFNTAIFWAVNDLSVVDNFGDMLRLVFDTSMIGWVYPLIVTIFSLLICFSLAYHAMEEDLKVGKLSFESPMSSINYTILPVGLTLFFLAIIMIVSKIVVASLAFALHSSLKNPELGYSALSTISIALMSVFLVSASIALFISMVLWVPSLIMSGYDLLDMIAFCIRLVSNNFWQLFGGIILPFAITISLVIFLTIVGINDVGLTFVKIAIYLFWILYLQSYSMIAYFDLTHTQIKFGIKK